MNKKSEFLIYSFFVLVILFFAEIAYIYVSKTPSKEALLFKKEFVLSIKLPDLCIATESSYVRHRSLSDFFSIYKDDGTLREYFASTYAISLANIQNKSINEK